MVVAALLLQCCWYSIRVGAPSPTLGRSPTADVGAHYKGGHPIWAAYRVALNSYRVGAPYKRRHPIRNKWASRNRGGVVVRERGGAGGAEGEGVMGEWKEGLENNVSRGSGTFHGCPAEEGCACVCCGGTVPTWSSLETMEVISR